MPLTAIAIKVAYDADLLAAFNATTAGAVAQGHHVALVVLGTLLAAALIRGLLGLFLDPRLARLHLPRRHRRRVVGGAWALLAAGVVVAVIVLSGTISHQYHRFLSPKSVNYSSDFRARLTDPGNDGRIDLWRVAWHRFAQSPVIGQGAGTFKNSYLTYRSTAGFAVNAHSLYLQTLDELGVVGFVLLVGLMLLILIRAGTRIRGPDRALYAAVFAVLLAYALEAGIDWDWEMPVVTIPFFVLGGFTLARSPVKNAATAAVPIRDARSFLSPPLRTILAIGCALAAVAPAYLWLSQRKLDRSTSAFAAGNCRLATSRALSSISILGSRAEPYEVVAYCDVHRDLPKLAITAIRHAVSLDPQNWNYWYGVSLMQAAAGENPLRAARRALQLNPKEPLAQQAWAAFSTDTPAQWQADGVTAADAFTSL